MEMKTYQGHLAWWLMSVILALRRQKQENHSEFKFSLGYVVSETGSQMQSQATKAQREAVRDCAQGKAGKNSGLQVVSYPLPSAEVGVCTTLVCCPGTGALALLIRRSNLVLLQVLEQTLSCW